MSDKPISPGSDYESSPEAKNDISRMRARGGNVFAGMTTTAGLNQDVDSNCRKDLPSPKRYSREEGNTSPREPKSPPKSVRFTEEDDEHID